MAVHQAQAHSDGQLRPSSGIVFGMAPGSVAGVATSHRSSIHSPICIHAQNSPIKRCPPGTAIVLMRSSRLPDTSQVMPAGLFPVVFSRLLAPEFMLHANLDVGVRHWLMATPRMPASGTLRNRFVTRHRRAIHRAGSSHLKNSSPELPNMAADQHGAFIYHHTDQLVRR